ncbi:hypothetical protein ACFRFH_12055 [Leifsonia sp. NPDC056824]|uniref:hypothetical protein n=1 Tax=Leifsonia sp. NPDC056824 TaxID=3345953 RepID=UPI0036B6FE05
MLDTIPDIELLIELVDMEDLRCGDVNHPRGISFHTAEASAEFLIVAPCCGDRGLLCRTRSYYLKYQAATIHCMRCDARWAPDRYQFIPLPGVLPI